MSEAKKSTPEWTHTLPENGRCRPNIVIINCDDLGYGDLPAYGNTVLITPHIDRLAQGGVRFTSFYACNSLCTPSRFGLLTGRYPDRVGLGWVLGAKRPGHRGKNLHSFWVDLSDRFWWWVAKQISKLGLMDYYPGRLARGISEREITIARALKTAGYRTGMVGKWHLGEFPIYPQFNPTRHGFDFFFGVPHSQRHERFRPVPQHRVPVAGFPGNG